jgi:hypothetical protein
MFNTTNSEEVTIFVHIQFSISATVNAVAAKSLCIVSNVCHLNMFNEFQQAIFLPSSVIYFGLKIRIFDTVYSFCTLNILNL